MKYIYLLFSIVTMFSASAQTMKFTAPIGDSTIYLARYFGSKLYYADTTNAVGGKFAFNGAKHKAGMYAILLPGPKSFDFIYDNEEIEIILKDTNKLVENLEVKKSINNKLFFDYLRYMNAKKAESMVISGNMKKPETTPEMKTKYTADLNKINDEVVAYQKNIIATNPTKFVAVLIKMTMDVPLPDYPRDEKGAITDSNYVYHYYVNHYWDNVDLKDPRIVNTPIFHTKLDKFFSKKGILQIPDTINYYATKLINQTDMKDQENKVFQYIVHHVTNKYETSPIMGLDAVFCYMANTYYCPPNNLAYWMTPENTEKVCERAEKVCRVMIGGNSVPIILPDSTEKKWYNTYDIKADYTVLYFWDPNCGHCKKVTPKLQVLYDKKFKERNIEIYAIGKGTGTEFAEWKNFIRKNNLTFINVALTDSIYKLATNPDQIGLTELLRKYTNIQSLNYADTWDIYSTPRIFILDKEKRIIYKQISIGQLEEILDKLTGHADDVKLFPLTDPENGDNPDEDDHDSH